MSYTSSATGVLIPTIMLVIGVAGCGNQAGPAGQPTAPVGVGYGTAGSQSMPPPRLGSGLSVPSSALSDIPRSGSGAIGPGQGINVSAPAPQRSVISGTGSAQGVTSGPASRVRPAY